MWHVRPSLCVITPDNCACDISPLRQSSRMRFAAMLLVFCGAHGLQMVGSGRGRMVDIVPHRRAQLSMTAVPRHHAPKPEQGRARHTERGLAAALAYASVSAVWYLAGMSLYLFSSSSTISAAPSQPLRRVIARLSTAWVLTFAASQVTTPWRAAGAVFISPWFMRALRRPSPFDKAGRRGFLLRSAVCAMTIVSFFAAGMAALGARELALL